MNAPITDLAYMAGALDSDGYIGVQRSTYKLRVQGDATQAIYSARVQLKQVEPEAVDLFHNTFGGHRFLTAPNTQRGRQLWTWQVHSAACQPVLEGVLPYLRIKRLRAENALETCRLCTLPKRFVVPSIVPGEPMVTVTEAAHRLGKHRGTIYQAVCQGSVPAVRGSRNGGHPTIFIPESFLAIWATRGSTPRRSSEVTGQLEACYQRAKELNHVGI